MNDQGEPATATKHGECLEEYRGAGGDDEHPAPLLHSLPHHHVQRAHAVQGRQDFVQIPRKILVYADIEYPYRSWINLLVLISSDYDPNTFFI